MQPPYQPGDPDFVKWFYPILSDFQNLRDKMGSSFGSLTDEEHGRLNQYYDLFNKLRDKFMSPPSGPAPQLGSAQDTAEYFNPVSNAEEAFRDTVRGTSGGGAGSEALFGNEAMKPEVAQDFMSHDWKNLNFLAEGINNRLSVDATLADPIFKLMQIGLAQQDPNDPMYSFLWGGQQGPAKGQLG